MKFGDREKKKEECCEVLKRSSYRSVLHHQKGNGVDGSGTSILILGCYVAKEDRNN